MGLRELFGPSKEEIWQKLCAEIGGDFIKGGFWRGDKVVARAKDWTITLDTYTVHTQHSHVTYTRMRAPYVNPDGFRFKIYRKGIFSELGKMLGMRDIEVGYPEFDEAFIIKGRDELQLRSLFASDRLRALLEIQPAIMLQVKDDERIFGRQFPDGVDELYFQVAGVIKDVKRLKDLYELFAVTLNRLCEIGSAYAKGPEVEL